MKFNNSIISIFNSKQTIQYLALLLILFLSLNLNLACEKGTESEQLKPGCYYSLKVYHQYSSKVYQ
ncbi:MAG: hypothetical protein COW71_00105 [Ignavibacteriales bacterium CG18_big_fil_WC_8_21_14_2_50_31_20]|nr:MAG: hypothetical protein COW71_00105 [Ignavibacteriales bacterium CG18_big_fil_WC_8_21_14_2_50_31_20]